MAREKRLAQRAKRPLDPAEQAQRMLEQIEWAEQLAERVPRRKEAAEGDEETEQEETRAR